MSKREKDPELDKLRAHLHSLDAREILEDLGIEYKEAGKNVSEGWIGINCPFPGCDDPSTHMGVNLRTKSITCFVCGKKGTIIKLAIRILGYKKAIAYLLKKVPRELIDLSVDDEDKETVYKVNVPDKMKFKKSAHWKYIDRVRHFSAKKLFEKYGLQCITDKCTDYDYRNRIFVPVYFKHRLVTFTTISIKKELAEKESRYLHCPDEDSIMSIKDVLYGYDDTDKHTCIVVEGLFDAWRIGDGAVCIFGTKFTSAQIKLLKTFKRVKLCFDADKAGYRAAELMSAELAAFTEVLVIFIPLGKDPDKLSKKDIDKIKNC